MHHHRVGHWVVVFGAALVKKSDEKFLVGENQSTYIPFGARIAYIILAQLL
jgi:mannose-1-phosphate guanylyltransferase/mannose-6-phosphate isomerase